MEPLPGFDPNGFSERQRRIRRIRHRRQTMIKWISIVTLSICVAACSQSQPAQSAAAGQAATPAPAAQAAPDAARPADAGSAAPAAAAPAPASAPAASTHAAAPASTPAASAPAGAPAAAAAPAAAPAAPPPPPAPTFREVTIPAGTSLSVKLLNHLA